MTDNDPRPEVTQAEAPLRDETPIAPMDTTHDDFAGTFMDSEPSVDEFSDDRLSKTEPPAISAPAGPLLCVVLVACPEDLESTVAGAVRAVDYRVDTDPSLAGSLAFMGPLPLARARRFRPFRGPSDAKRVWAGIRDGLGQVRIGSSVRVAVGLVVVDYDLASLRLRLNQITGSPELLAFPVHIQGVSLTPARGDIDTNLVVLDPAAGPNRLDSVLLERAEAVVQEAEIAGSGVMPARLLAQLVTSVRPVTGPTSTIHAVRMADEEMAAAHEARVEATHSAAPMTRPVASRQRTVDDKYHIPERLPLRLAYIVLAWGVESRPKEVRRRMISLAQSVDDGLTPTRDWMTSRTTLVAAGQGKDRQRMLMQGAPASSVLGSWRPTMDYLDMAETMRQLVDLITHDMASYNRRSQPLERPLVAFIMPSAAMSGPKCLSYYRKVKQLADVGWLITDEEAPPPSYEVDSSTLVLDKEDAVNELLHVVGYPPEMPEAPDNDAAEDDSGEEFDVATGHEPDE